MAYQTERHTYVSTSTGTPGARAGKVATLTVLGWNLPPLAAIVAGVLIAVSRSDETNGWSTLAAAAIGVIGGGAMVVSLIAGIVIGRIHVKHAITRGKAPSGFGIGTLAAFLGWLIVTALGAVLYPARDVIFSSTWF